MSQIHYLKKAEHEVVVKCYTTESNGGIIDISLADLAVTGETFDEGTADVGIQEIYWGAKKDKQLDISRILDADNVHSHYYLTNSGSYDFNGFLDDVYSSKDIRITADGPCHVIIKLKKTAGYT